jgi:hypothetical protein
MDLISLLFFVLWVVTMIWFTRRLNSIAKDSSRTADALEVILALQRSEAKRKRSEPVDVS